MSAPPIAVSPMRAARRLGVRLALFAWLLIAVVPSLMRLANDAGAAPCPMVGMAAAPANAPSPPSHDKDGDVACPLCALAHTTPVIGSVAAPIAAVVAYAPPAPAVPPAAPARDAQLRPPTARGPPVLA
jgi:hypothetical protein